MYVHTRVARSKNLKGQRQVEKAQKNLTCPNVQTIPFLGNRSNKAEWQPWYRRLCCRLIITEIVEREIEGKKTSNNVDSDPGKTQICFLQNLGKLLKIIWQQIFILFLSYLGKGLG